MSDTQRTLAYHLFDLDNQIDAEIRAFSDNVNALTETPTKEQYSRFCGHLEYIQDMVTEADREIRTLELEKLRNDPDFLKLLQTKDSILEHSAQYSRLRNAFFKK